MNDPNDVTISVTHECGREFEVPLAGRNLETLEYICPGCGAVENFAPEQVAAIVAAHEQLVRENKTVFREVARDLTKR